MRSMGFVGDAVVWRQEKLRDVLCQESWAALLSRRVILKWIFWSDEALFWCACRQICQGVLLLGRSVELWMSWVTGVLLFLDELRYDGC